VYETAAATEVEPLPQTDAVFLASPSTARAFRRRAGALATERSVAIAIGPTTAEAVRADPELAFASLFQMRRPDVRSFESCLEDVARSRPPSAP